MLVCGGGASERSVGHEGGARRSGISALTTEAPGSPAPFWPSEDTKGRWPSVNQEAGSHPTLNLPAP